MSADPPRPSRRAPSPAGSALAAAVGALSAGLAGIVWLVVTSILTRFDPHLPLGTLLVGGAALGLGASWTRAGRNTPITPIVLLAAGLGSTWLAATGLDPLRIGPGGLGWSLWGTLALAIAAAQLTRQGLRGLDLSALHRDALERVVVRLLRAAGFSFFIAIVAFPFYFMVVASLKPRASYLADPTLLNVEFGRGLNALLVGYREVLFTFDFARYILNSTGVALATVAITLVLAILGAYAVTRLRFPGRRWLSRSILLIYMFPAIVLVVPLYSVFTQLELRDSLLGLLIVYPASTIPVALYMLRSYFATLPADLEEAGMIDGATRAGVIWRITLPLSMPAIATVGLYVFMIAWNEFLFAFMFLDTPELFTLPRGMVNLNSQEVPRQYLMAGAVIVTLPVMLLFFWFERYLTGGLTSGGVKE